MSSVLAFALPCPRCHAKAGERCVNLDGSPRGPKSHSHVNRTPVQPCGTFGGVQRHRKRGETPCDDCLEAQRRYMADWRAKTPRGRKSREVAIDALRARRRATSRLIAKYRADFEALLAEEAS